MDNPPIFKKALFSNMSDHTEFVSVAMANQT